MYDDDDYDDWTDTPGNDLELWEHQWVLAKPPFSTMFRLARCRRQDITNKMSQRLGFPGAAELAPDTHELLWSLHEVIADAYDLHNLRPQRAAQYLEEAFDRGRFLDSELGIIARDRGMAGYRFSTTIDTVTEDFERVLVTKMTPALTAMLHDAAGGSSKRRRPRKRAS